MWPCVESCLVQSRDKYRLCVQLIIWKVCLFISWKYEKIKKIYEYEYLFVPIYIYIYIYIYIVLFGPVKPELGVIPSGQEIIHEWIFKFSW